MCRREIVNVICLEWDYGVPHANGPAIAVTGSYQCKPESLVEVYLSFNDHLFYCGASFLVIGIYLYPFPEILVSVPVL